MTNDKNSLDKNSLDKNLIAEVVSKAMDNYLKHESDEEGIVEDVVDTVESVESDVVTESESVDDDIKETDVQEEVDEIVEEQILQSGDYNFLGLDINISDDEEGKFNVVIKKDDKEKLSVLDAVNLPNIFGLIEEFFTEIVIDDEVVEDETVENEIEDELKESEELEDVLAETVIEEEVLANDNSLTENDYSESLMADLRLKYHDKVNEIFNQGVLAKEIALDMIKETILADTVKELVEKNKEKDAIIAEKKKDLNKVTKSFVIANTYYDGINKIYTLLSSAVKELETDLTNGVYNTITAKKIMNKYNSILSTTLEAKNVDSLNNIIATLNKTQTVIASHKDNVAKKIALLESKTVDNKEKEINTIVKPVIEKKNVMNSDGWKDNKTILSRQHRYDSIEEMSAELLKIAGI